MLPLLDLNSVVAEIEWNDGSEYPNLKGWSVSFRNVDPNNPESVKGLQELLEIATFITTFKQGYFVHFNVGTVDLDLLGGNSETTITIDRRKKTLRIKEETHPLQEILKRVRLVGY